MTEPTVSSSSVALLGLCDLRARQQLAFSFHQMRLHCGTLKRRLLTLLTKPTCRHILDSGVMNFADLPLACANFGGFPEALPRPGDHPAYRALFLAARCSSTASRGNRPTAPQNETRALRDCFHLGTNEGRCTLLGYPRLPQWMPARFPLRQGCNSRFFSLIMLTTLPPLCSRGTDNSWALDSGPMTKLVCFFPELFNTKQTSFLLNC